MENPNTWTEIHHAIADALKEFNEAMEAGICGPSNVSMIYDKLKEKGFLNFMLPSVTPIDPARAYMDLTPTCNRHDDCDAADQEVKDRGVRGGEWGQLRTRADHCYSEDCEECFGK